MTKAGRVSTGRVATGITAMALIGLAVTGCGPAQDNSAQNSSSGSGGTGAGASGGFSMPNLAGTANENANQPPAPSSAPKCTAGDVTGAFVKFHTEPTPATDAGINPGEAVGWIQVTNNSKHACGINGYGGAEFYSAGDGRPIGIKLQRTKPNPAPVTLRPGDKAVKRVDWVPNPPSQPGADGCSAFPGLISVILPDDTKEFQIDVTGQNLPEVCNNSFVYGSGYQAN